MNIKHKRDKRVRCYDTISVDGVGYRCRKTWSNFLGLPWFVHWGPHDFPNPGDSVVTWCHDTIIVDGVELACQVELGHYFGGHRNGTTRWSDEGHVEIGSLEYKSPPSPGGSWEPKTRRAP